jgi:2-phosphosulfolactate phosphatase
MDPLSEILAQQTYRCRFDWGRAGVRRAALRRDIVAVVDVLRFSTAVVTAVEQGALIYPCAPADDADELARRVGAEVAGYRLDTAPHRYSLSPASYDRIAPGTRVVLPSPNGAACSRAAQEAPYVLIGALVNAQAVGAAVSVLMKETDRVVTIIACGERWPAVEDYLGAGAILSYLLLDKSPEARVCEAAFLATRDQLEELVRESISGRELHHKGLGADVERAAQLNLYNTVPILRHERLEPFQR